jgi:hypothetical protein
VLLEHRRLLELATDAGARDLGLAQLCEVDRSALKNAVPSSGRVLPVMTSIIVVLPAPFGPDDTAQLRRHRRSAIARSARGSPEADADGLEIENRTMRRADAGRQHPAVRGPPSDTPGRRRSAFASKRSSLRLASRLQRRDAAREVQRDDDEDEAERVQPVFGQRLREPALCRG